VERLEGISSRKAEAEGGERRAESQKGVAGAVLDVFEWRMLLGLTDLLALCPLLFALRL
jgi:hypothetical protein